MNLSFKKIIPANLKLTQIFAFGMISGLIFAPVFLFPAIFTFSILCWHVRQTKTLKDALLSGYIFGLGHFLTSLYWIAIGVNVYIEDFWWFIPFALFGLPLILATFIALVTSFSWIMRRHECYQIIFCLLWVLAEWLRSWILSGFPWNLLAYSLSFSTTMIQTSSIFSVYGLSFLIIYLATSLYSYFERNLRQLKVNLTVNIILFSLVTIYGAYRLHLNPTIFTDHKVKIIQPSVPQSDKWDPESFWNNLDEHINLSILEPEAGMIIWPESALIIPYNKIPAVHNAIQEIQEKTGATLVTGSVAEESNLNFEEKLYTTMIAIDKSANPIFEYKKIHLVPFGEYIPFKTLLPLKKITSGLIDYSPGFTKIVSIISLKLNIRPLICYEAIFPDEARITDNNVDAFINISNDAWYGRSSGPYQHLYISIMRAVENGIPLLRASNNGISAAIDPCGRILQYLPLNAKGQLNILMPSKLNDKTLYSQYGNLTIIFAVILVVLIQLLISLTLQTRKIK